MRARTDVHTYTCTRTDAHASTHMCTHMRPHTCTHMHTHVCNRTHTRAHTSTHTPTFLSSQLWLTVRIAPWLSQTILTELLLSFASHVLPREQPAASHPNQDPRLPTEPGMGAGGDADGKVSGLTVAGGPRRARPPPAPPSLSCRTFTPCSSTESPRKGSSSVKPEHAQAARGPGGIFLPTQHLTFLGLFSPGGCAGTVTSFLRTVPPWEVSAQAPTLETASPGRVYPARVLCGPHPH